MLKIYSVNGSVCRYFAFALVLGACIWGFLRFRNPQEIPCVWRVDKEIVYEHNQAYTYENMNGHDTNTTNRRHLTGNLAGNLTGQLAEDHVLILTPLKEAARHIERYFTNINRLTYPHHLISLGFLTSDSFDDTTSVLRDYVAWFTTQGQTPWEGFRSITILQKDFGFILPDDKRHDYDVQLKRREIMSRSRNYLLTSTLQEDISWVLWLDVDVIDYPETLLDDLISVNKDIVVPNCMWHSYNEEGGYDLNNWRETEESLALQEKLGPNEVLMEGYKERETGRNLMINMKDAANEANVFYKIPLDGVGGTCTLVRAEVHRQGAIFPPFAFKHALETEGLAKMAKSMGFEIWGLPNYQVYHFI